MPRREPPPTKEGLFALHDLRTIDWMQWREADGRARSRALADVVDFFDYQTSDSGEFVIASVLGHKADLMLIYLRPSAGELDTAMRGFEQTTLANYTHREFSFVSVTEVSGYSSTSFFDDGAESDPGLERYMKARLHPSIPEAEFVSFYPMSKRRDPEYNWYDLSFAERANHMKSHGEIGRRFGGKVTQIITGAIGYDDWEWGVTLFANDPIEIKKLLYEMRFDPSTSKYAEFGPFFVGHPFDPAEIETFLNGNQLSIASIPKSQIMPDDIDHDDSDINGLVESLLGAEEVADHKGDHGVIVRSNADLEDVTKQVDDLRGNFEHYDSHQLTEVHHTDTETVVISLWENERAASIASGYLEDLDGVTSVELGTIGRSTGGEKRSIEDEESISQALADLDIYAGKPHGEDVHAMVLYSTAALSEVKPDVENLTENFHRYDTHVQTDIYEGSKTNRRAIVSVWETQDAAETAGEYLSNLPELDARAGEESGFGTMGMFYTVKSEHREDFLEKFEEVAGLLEEMDGHVETELMTNIDNEDDMFIASQWRSKEDALEFFRSDEFRDTVAWGRDILADRPRHVFLS